MLVWCFILSFLIPRTGSAEEFTEKHQLLTELSDLYAEKSVPQERAAQAVANDRQLAMQMRDAACTALASSSAKAKKPGSTPLTPTTPADDSATTGEEPRAKRKPNSSASGIMDPIVEYMAAKSAQDRELTRKEMDEKKTLEEKKMELEREKLQLQREEMAARMDMQKKELEARTKAEEEKRRADQERERAQREEMREERRMMMDCMRTMMESLKK